jgi:hypothetical protein
MMEISPSEENNNSTYSVLEETKKTTDINQLYQQEEISRKIGHANKIPERFAKPTDVTQQKRLIQKTKLQLGTRKCYTCFPKRLAREHTIQVDEENKVKFHFDMCNRPLIIATPFEHITSITEFGDTEDVNKFFVSISKFCKFWNIKDYQIQINHGSWQHHEHLHAKIRGNEDLFFKLRQDHFKLIKMTKERTSADSAQS